MTTSHLSNFSPRSSSLLHFVLESTITNTGNRIVAERGQFITFVPLLKSGACAPCTYLIV